MVMALLTDLANGTADAIQLAVTYLQKNAWPILFLLAVGWYLSTKVWTPMVLERAGPRDSPSRTRSLQDDMRRVRLAQQEAAQKRALEAHKERQQKQEQHKQKKAERVRKTKNDLDDPFQKKGNKLGYAHSDNSRSFNPLNPNSNPTQRYRPASRSTRRG